MPDITIRISAIDKLLDYGASGFGAVAGPILAPWRASREGKARLNSARFDAEVHQLQAESDARSLQIIADAQAKARQSLDTTAESSNGMVEITRADIIQRIEFQERKRLTNIKSVMDYAADQLEEKEVPDHEPDPDWTARFFNDAQDVSTEDMQKIWAKILAGEVESPGRTSLRTLDTLRNMTKRDAEMFRDMCDFVINQDFVFYGESAKGFESLNYSKLLHLQDCGLVNVGPNLVKMFTWGSDERILLTYQYGVLEMTRDAVAKDVLRLPDILLTTAGKELSQLVRGTLQMEYLMSLSKFLKSEKCQLYYQEGVSQLPVGMVQYASRTLIEPESESVEESTP